MNVHKRFLSGACGDDSSCNRISSISVVLHYVCWYELCRLAAGDCTRQFAVCYAWRCSCGSRYRLYVTHLIIFSFCPAFLTARSAWFGSYEPWADARLRPTLCVGLCVYVCIYILSYLARTDRCNLAMYMPRFFVTECVCVCWQIFRQKLKPGGVLHDFVGAAGVFAWFTFGGYASFVWFTFGLYTCFVLFDLRLIGALVLFDLRLAGTLVLFDSSLVHLFRLIYVWLVHLFCLIYVWLVH